MSDRPDDRSARITRWWVRRYTAGLEPAARTSRRLEIDSDLAEHVQSRCESGWTPGRIARERQARLIRGVPADVGWRHDQLQGRSSRPVTVATTSLTAAASLFLAAFHAAFAVYLLGNTSLADRQILGRRPLQGFENYADEVDRQGAFGAILIISTMALLLLITAVIRPLSPIVANAVVLPIALLSVMFFWLGIWPIGLIVLIGSGADLVSRSPRPTPSR